MQRVVLARFKSILVEWNDARVIGHLIGAEEYDPAVKVARLALIDLASEIESLNLTAQNISNLVRMLEVPDFSTVRQGRGSDILGIINNTIEKWVRNSRVWTSKALEGRLYLPFQDLDAKGTLTSKLNELASAAKGTVSQKEVEAWVAVGVNRAFGARPVDLAMLHHALTAAETLAAEGVSVEVIDPRTLVPLDHETIVASVRKTGRLLVVDEAYLPCGIQGEVIAQVTERAFGALRAAPRRLGNPGVPVPFAPPLEDAVLPGPALIAATIRDMFGAW